MTRSRIVSRIAHDACFDEPSLAPGASWWDELADDFAARPEPFRLQLKDNLQVRAGATIDLFIRTIGACAVGLTAGPVGYNLFELRKALRDARFYGAMAETHDPSRFFVAPPTGVDATIRGARLPLFRPTDGVCLDLSFVSPFEPVNPRERASYLSHVANRTAYARWWRHQRGPRPTVIAIHGFGAEHYHLNEYFFALPFLYALGLDVVLFTLPFHGKRRARVSPFTGYGFFSAGMGRVNESFAQSIFDLRILLDMLLGSHGVPAVGVTGVSLGGYTAALLASVDPRLVFAIPNVPMVSLADLVLEWKPIGPLLRTSMSLLGGSVRDARYAMAVTSPLTYQPLLPRERLMVIGGVGDRLAPPKHARLLWEHWDRCALHWFPGNHLLHLDRGAYLREIARFLRGHGLLTRG